MLRKNTGIFQILITLSMIFSAFISKYNAVAYLMAIFFISSIVSYSVCNFSCLKSLCMTGCAIVFYVVTSFVEQSLMLSDIFTLSVLFIPGFVLGICFKTKLSFKDTFVIALAIDFIILIAALAVSKFIYNINITAEIRDTFLLSDFDDNLGLLKSLSPEAFEQFVLNEHQIFNTLYILVPGLLPFAFGLVFVFTFLMQYGISKLLCTEYLVRSCSYGDGFDSFRPGIVTNITMILMVVTVMYETSQSIVMMCINAALFILLIYFITALSFIEHKLKQRALYPGKRFAILAAVLVLSVIFSVIIPVINLIFIFVFFGFLDSMFDFRKLKTKKVN